MQCTWLLMGLVGNSYVYWDDLLGPLLRDLLLYLVLLHPPLTCLTCCTFSLIIPSVGLLLIFCLRSGMVFMLVWQPLNHQVIIRQPSVSSVMPGCHYRLHFSSKGGRSHVRPWQILVSLHVNPIGLVPKSHDRDAWRMTVDLSYPRGQSVNDFIPSSLCSLSYLYAVDYILELGRFTQMVKFDLKSMYHILPIHPCNQSVHGMSEGQVYLNHCLPFGLCSAPKIFIAFADALAWVLHQAGVRDIIHYLDDFLFFGSPPSVEGSQTLTTAFET